MTGASRRRVPARGVPKTLLPHASAALAARPHHRLATHRPMWHPVSAGVTTLSGKGTSTGDNMGLLDNVLAGGVIAAIGATIVGLYRESQETSRRRNSPLCFSESCSQIEFTLLVKDVAEHTPRVSNAVVTGMTAVIHVKSNRGLSTWKAEIDFNDYGTLTGKYWIDAENSDSIIPQHFADGVNAKLRHALARKAI